VLLLLVRRPEIFYSFAFFVQCLNSVDNIFCLIFDADICVFGPSGSFTLKLVSVTLKFQSIIYFFRRFFFWGGVLREKRSGWKNIHILVVLFCCLLLICHGIVENNRTGTWDSMSLSTIELLGYSCGCPILSIRVLWL